MSRDPSSPSATPASPAIGTNPATVLTNLPNPWSAESANMEIRPSLSQLLPKTSFSSPDVFPVLARLVGESVHARGVRIHGVERRRASLERTERQRSLACHGRRLLQANGGLLACRAHGVQLNNRLSQTLAQLHEPGQADQGRTAYQAKHG